MHYPFQGPDGASKPLTISRDRKKLVEWAPKPPRMPTEVLEPDDMPGKPEGKNVRAVQSKVNCTQHMLLRVRSIVPRK